MNKSTIEFWEKSLHDRVTSHLYLFFKTKVLPQAYLDANQQMERIHHVLASDIKIDSAEFEQESLLSIKRTCESILSKSFAKDQVQALFADIMRDNMDLEHIVVALYTLYSMIVHGDDDDQSKFEHQMFGRDVEQQRRLKDSIVHKFLQNCVSFAASEFSMLPQLLDSRNSERAVQQKIHMYDALHQSIDKAARSLVRINQILRHKKDNRVDHQPVQPPVHYPSEQKGDSIDRVDTHLHHLIEKLEKENHDLKMDHRHLLDLYETANQILEARKPFEHPAQHPVAHAPSQTPSNPPSSPSTPTWKVSQTPQSVATSDLLSDRLFPDLETPDTKVNSVARDNFDPFSPHSSNHSLDRSSQSLTTIPEAVNDNWFEPDQDLDVVKNNMQLQYDPQ